MKFKSLVTFGEYLFAVTEDGDLVRVYVASGTGGNQPLHAVVMRVEVEVFPR